jgi:uncharacterized membrane protein
MNATSTESTAADPDYDAPALVVPGRAVPLGSGWDWVTGGWKLFVRAPLMWIISMILVFICFIVIGFVPILGGIAVQLLQPVVMAGFMVASHSLERGGDFELDHLLAGFRKNFGSLVLVGLLFLVGGIVIFLIFLSFVAFTIGTAILTGDPNQALTTILASGIMFLLGGLIAVALLLPLTAAYWFAPALVIMHDMPAGDAMKHSFFACFRNFFPFVIYGIVILVLAVVAAIPIGLGFLVLIPMTIAGVYVSYREIFTEDSAPVPAKPTFA